jgi:hypothetical protein
MFSKSQIAGSQERGIAPFATGGINLSFFGQYSREAR